MKGAAAPPSAIAKKTVSGNALVTPTEVSWNAAINVYEEGSHVGSW